MIMIAPPTQAQTLVWWSWSRGSVGDACRPVSPFGVCPSALIADGFELLTKHRHGRFEICLVLLQHITPRLPQHLPLVSRTSESREQVSQQGTSTTTVTHTSIVEISAPSGRGLWSGRTATSAGAPTCCSSSSLTSACAPTPRSKRIRR